MNCKHVDEKGNCKKLSDDVVKQPCVEAPCDMQEDRVTNADRIRSMTDEELMRDFCGCRHCMHFGNCKANGTHSCGDGILAWLNKEVEE